MSFSLLMDTLSTRLNGVMFYTVLFLLFCFYSVKGFSVYLVIKHCWN